MDDPLPADAQHMQQAVRDAARDAVVLDSDDLVALAADRLGLDATDPGARRLLERIEDDLCVEFGPLVWLSGDRTASVEAVARDIVLTHLLRAEEHATDRLSVGLDLAAFAWELAPTHDGQDLEVLVDDEEGIVWEGPAGWLHAWEPTTILAVRLDANGRVSIDPLPAPPPVSQSLVDAILAAYDDELDETRLPVAAAELLTSVCVADPDAFTSPEAPLSVLCEEAGLDARGARFADDPAVWRMQRRLGDLFTITALEGEDEGLRHAATEVLRDCDALTDGEPLHPDVVARVLDDLADVDVLALVDDPLAGDDPTPDGGLSAPIAALLGVARRPRHVAAVRYLAALHAERHGDTAAAEQHLELAFSAQPDFPPATDRLAWYASDRGDAVRATRLWRRLPLAASATTLLDELEPFTRPVAMATTPSRNDPCWCGSGRKYKRCHLDVPPQPALAERVGWLCRKATTYVERSGPDVVHLVWHVAAARAGRDAPDWAQVMGDPLVMDLVLVEGGAFAQFLADRGDLLPDDEALLAASWLTVPRTVYEVTDVVAGQGLSARDLRTGEVVEVRERAFARQATAGQLVCARAVPDGRAHQLVGAVIPVRPGEEGALLDVLDTGDPEAIAEWVGAREQPPTMTNREGEAAVAITIRASAADAGALRRHLDATYEVEAPGAVWAEHHPLDGDESLIRGRLTLQGDRLQISTNSAERADRILGRLDAAVAYRVESDERVPVTTSADFARMAAGMAPPPQGEGEGGALPAEAVEQIQQHMEARWCEESVPALGGLTPRQAAADPTRREELERLLRSFETAPTLPGGFGMRTDRLRALLDM